MKVICCTRNSTLIRKVAIGMFALSTVACVNAQIYQPGSQAPSALDARPPTAQSVNIAVVITPPSTPTVAPPTPTAAPEPRLLSPAFARQQTTVADDLSQDGQSWSQATPILIDKYDKIIVPSQRYNGADKFNIFVYSNDQGKSWSDNAAFQPERFIERGAAAYDAKNDLVHMLWIGMSATDGVFYRRYIPARDGSNNLTGIAKAEGASLSLDKQLKDSEPMQYQHPVLLHLSDAAFGQYGGLLAVWSARNRGPSAGNELRASMCVLGASPTSCDTAAGWTAPVQAGKTTIGNQPQVAYSGLLANKTVDIAYASLLRKQAGTNAGDVYVFYHDGGATAAGVWAFERLRWNAQLNNWSAGITPATIITAQQRAGNDTGYSLKQQLGSRPAEDPANDRVYFGFASWKDDSSGDTWSFVYADAKNGDALSPIVDVYSAAGSHSYAPTGDITFDAPSGRLVVAYIKTQTQHIFTRLYDGTQASGAEMEAFGAAPVDIPLLASQSRYGSPPKLLMVFRDTINTPQPPYHGWAGTLTWQ